jgi:hypothetical protein
MVELEPLVWHVGEVAGHLSYWRSLAGFGEVWLDVLVLAGISIRYEKGSSLKLLLLLLVVAVAVVVVTGSA